MLRSISSLSHPRLRLILAASLFLILCVPALIAGYGFYWYMNRTVAEDVEHQLTSLAAYRAGQVSSWVEERQFDLGIVGQLPATNRWVKAIHDGVPGACDSLRMHLERQRRLLSPRFASFLLLDVNGELICPDTIPFTPDGRAFARATGNATAVSGRGLGPGMSRPFLEVYVPVRQTPERPFGVLVGFARSDGISHVISDIRPNSTEHLHLADQDGRLLSCSQPAGHAGAHDRVPIAPLELFRQNPGNAQIYWDERGVEVIGVSRRIPALHWTMLVEQDFDEAFRRLIQLRRVLVVLIVILVALSTVVSVVVSSVTVRRLDQRDREMRTTHEQLITADRLASVGMMAASIAHEINNPLTTIKVLIHSLRKHPASDDARSRDLGIVLAEIDKIKSLVLRFLQFARPRDPELSSVRIEDILARIAQLVRPQAQIQGLLLYEEYDRSAGPVWVDGAQIGQVFLNILLNAVEATPPGGEIRLSTAATGKQTVTVTIWNSGPAIPAELEERIFEPFFSTKATGTGLGLSIARTIAEKHHGTLRAKGHGENGGTSFTITLQSTDKESSHAPRSDRG